MKKEDKKGLIMAYVGCILMTIIMSLVIFHNYYFLEEITLFGMLGFIVYSSIKSLKS